MPELSDITYSRDVCIAAVRDYYNFLTKLYLDPSDVVEPPPEGWPAITNTSLSGLGKTDEVISLLRHLPYIRPSDDGRDVDHGAAGCTFADWESDTKALNQGTTDAEELRMASESASLFENVPPHVIGLTSGSRDNVVFLLDTKLGIVHWYECPDRIRDEPSRELVEDDAYDYAPENEAEWRADAPAWPVADFFEVLKDQFQKLKFIPTSQRVVVDIYTTFPNDSDGMMEMLQDVYRQHDWPNVGRYRKRNCLEAVKKALEEHYPDYAEED